MGVFNPIYFLFLICGGTRACLKASKGQMGGPRLTARATLKTCVM